MRRGFRATCVVVAGVLLSGLVSAIVSPTAQAATVNYEASQTLPVPPASSYAGSGGGDGWGTALSATAVYNVFHHAYSLTVACHLQADASSCWNPVTITGPLGNFGTSAHTSMWLDSQTEKLYVYATQLADSTAGVVCVDTTVVAGGGAPYCGFTALSPVGDAPSASGFGGLADGTLVGTRWFAFNHGHNLNPNRGALLCFDTVTKAPCAGQPYSVTWTSTVDSSSDYPSPGMAAIGTRIVMGLTGDSGPELSCFDASTNTTCAGSWPIASPGDPSGFGAPFPQLNEAGTVTGACLPDGGASCFDLTGGSVAAPAGLASTVPSTSGWNGAAVTLGARVYIPNGNTGQIHCYDFSASAGCANFPKAVLNAGLVYSVNRDPARPTCLWTNADNGSGQIQNFDAYTAGACGQGPIRVLASSFVVPTVACQPSTYTGLQVTEPAPGTYTSGTVAFQDTNANPIPGTPELALDATGAVSMAGLSLNTAAGLPQFLITLNGAGGTPSAVTVKLRWSGTDDPSCVGPGTTVTGVGNPATLSILVMGDSYSAGNGAGNYYGAAGCWRSRNNYGYQYARLIAGAPYNQTSTVQVVACSGDETSAITKSNNNRPPQVNAVKAQNLVLMTLGGNDIHFGDIVKFCLIAKTRDGANCGPNLTRAERMLADGTVKSRLKDAIKAIRAKLPASSAIVLLGYPYLEGDPTYRIRSGHFGNTFIQAGARIRSIGDSGDNVAQQVISELSGDAGARLVFIPTKNLFAGPPNHELYAQSNNANRWFVQPFIDSTVASKATWYHPNPTGWAEEAKLLYRDTRVPK